MKGKYNSKVYDVLCNAANKGECIPSLTEISRLVGCPITGRGRISQVIKALEEEGLISRLTEAGRGVSVTVQIVITETGQATKRRRPDTLWQGRPALAKAARAAAVTEPKNVKAPQKPKRKKPQPKPAPAPTRLRGVPVSRPVATIFKHCQWIEGEPKDREFCGAKTLPGSPWCPEHYERCYLKSTLTRMLFERTKTTVDVVAKVA